MGCINWCPTCNKELRGDWRVWRSCSCGTNYFVDEADEIAYGPEPIDGFWDGRGSKDLVTRQSMSREANSETAKETEGLAHNSTTEETCRQGESQAQQSQVAVASNATDIPHDRDEDYFKNMILVYDPIFNFVCRNIFCRCILGATSFTSQAPRIDILCINLPCPRHATAGFQVKRGYIADDFETDYDQDSYFDKFGGYQSFLKWARYINQTTIAQLFMDLDKLYPNEISPEDLDPWTERHIVAVKEYWAEILPKLQHCWETRMKPIWKEKHPSLVAPVDAKFIVDRRELADVFQRDEAVSARLGIFSSVVEQSTFPVICKGRVTMESLEAIENESSLCPIY